MFICSVLKLLLTICFITTADHETQYIVYQATPPTDGILVLGLFLDVCHVDSVICLNRSSAVSIVAD